MTSVQELIDQAESTIAALRDAVRDAKEAQDARDLERFESGDEFGRSVSADEVAGVRVAVEARIAAERDVVSAIRDARGRGVSWQMIGRAVGTTGQAASQRYGKLIG